MAAINGFTLILKHSASFMFTRGIGHVFNFLGKLSVCVLNCIFAYMAIYEIEGLKVEVNSPIAPLLIVFIMTYAIASLYLAMYTTTATCLLHCLFADVDICKQLDYDEFEG